MVVVPRAALEGLVVSGPQVPVLIMLVVVVVLGLTLGLSQPELRRGLGVRVVVALDQLELRLVVLREIPHQLLLCKVMLG